MCLFRLQPPSWAPATFCLSFASCLAPDALGADPSGRDKSRYTLWNPTPSSLMREMSADRPDKTDSAYTVDAGHYQVEMDFVNWTIDRHNPERSDVRVSATEVAPMNVKVGLLNQLDLQLVLPAWHDETVRDFSNDTMETRRGFTDLIPRFKVNLWGNDGGATALGLLPFVKIPTGSRAVGNGAWEGGVKFPFALDLPGWDLSAMTEYDWLRNQRGSGHHPEFVNTVSVGRELAHGVSVYSEFYSNVSAERGASWIGTFDTWLTYQFSANLRLDGGVYVGVTRSAPDWHPFIGLTWRY